MASVSAREFFHDCPWLNLPAHRMAEILVEPRLPRGGLLGGSSASGGKLSKLATLAAKRRQEGSYRQRTAIDASETSIDDPASVLGRLRSTKHDAEDSPRSSMLLLRKQINGQDSTSEQDDKPPRLPLSQEVSERSTESELPGGQQIENTLKHLRADPSPFARTLVDSQPATSSLFSNFTSVTTYPALSSFDFSQPSPDDVVRQSQSFKGPR